MFILPQKNSYIWTLLLFFFLYQSSLALSPMWGYISLVAGESSAGHQDGSFYNATFNHPLGLAINATGDKLYVSDKDNNCIRMVDFNNQNEVSTLAGRDQEGYQDGSFDTALFRSPTCLVFISPTQLAVFDAGNHRIRVLDLVKKTVATLAGNGTDGMQEGIALQCALGTIWSMVYQASQNSLFLSEPTQDGVQKLDLKTNQIITVFQHRAEVPNPEALCLWKDQIYVADRNLNEIYQLVEQGDGKFLFNPIGEGHAILALSASEKGIYAIQNDPASPLRRIIPQDLTGPIHLVSAWGETLPTPGDTPPCFDGISVDNNLQFIPDPFSPECFYIANPQWNCLFSFHDIFQDEFIATGPDTPLPTGLTDWDYPPSKPPHTFRILMVGDSHIYHTFPDDHKKRGWAHDNLMDGLTKRLELELNTLASLDDSPVHFEVLTQAMPGIKPLFLWPYYFTPTVAKKYDVDLVLMMFSPNMFTPGVFNGRTNNDTEFSFQSYFLRSLTAEGIPTQDRDPESLLKPIAEKMPSGLAGDFFKLCQSKKLARIEDKELWFADFNQLVAEPEIKKDLVQLIGKPIRMLKDKIGVIRTSSGRPVPFYLGILPTGQFFPVEAQKPFWNDLRDYTGIPLLNLSDDFVALRSPWFPISDHTEYDHFSSDGYFVEALVLAHELIKQNLIPWPSVEKAK